jgi:hypothetical protein
MIKVLIKLKKESCVCRTPFLVYLYEILLSMMIQRSSPFLMTKKVKIKTKIKGRIFHCLDTFYFLMKELLGANLVTYYETNKTILRFLRIILKKRRL